MFLFNMRNSFTGSMLKRMLVFVLVFQLICSFYTLPAIADPAQTLPTASEVIAALKQRHPDKGHPRILATAGDFAKVRQNIENDDFANYLYQQVKSAAQATLSKPLPTSISLSVSRETLNDLLRLGLMVQVGDVDKTPYVNKAWQILERIGGFSHWNPGHFLDTAEMLMAFAIGYDWFYDEWNNDQRAFIRNAIVTKGLQPALNAYNNGYGASAAWWANVTFNWNTVCNSGIVNAALAIGDEADAEAIAGNLLEKAIAHIQKVLGPAAPDGGAEEGTGYWEYNYKYFVFYAASMFSALGTDYGFTDAPGISETPYFPIYLCGPGGSFNYADNYTEVVKDPLFFWFAKRFDNPDFSSYRLGHLTENTQPEELDLLWYDPEMKRDSYRLDLPPDRLFTTVDVGSMRSAWYDRNALYVGLKGSNNSYNHNHLDQGTFVLDALGIRWAIDLGPDSYSLPNYFELVNGRSQYYRQRTEGHNTIVLNPGQEDGQLWNAHGDIERYGFASEQAFMIINMSEAYQKHAHEVKRGMALIDNRTKFLLQDEIKMKQPGVFYWFMHTRADVTIEDNGRSALLTMGDKRLWAHILTDQYDLKFSVRDPEPLPSSVNPGGQAANSGVKLTIYGPEIDELQLAVLFVPLLDWQEPPQDLPAVTDLDEWSVPEGEAALLEKITVDGDEVEDFSSTKFIYYHGIQSVTEIPRIEAVPADVGDTVVMEMPETLPGIATIRVQPGDSSRRSTEYRVVLSLPFNPNAAVSASTHDGNIPENTLDGSLSTRWSAEGDGQWIQYKLVEPKVIDKVKIAFYNGHTRSTIFDILVSADGFTWEEVYSGQSSGTTSQFETFEFAPVMARYIRIVGHGNTSNAWNSITEVDFDGKPAVTIPDKIKSVRAAIDSATIGVGETVQMQVEAVSTSGAPFDLSNADLKYFTADPDIATINEQGLITGVGHGRTKLWAEVTVAGYTKVAIVELEVDDGTISLFPTDDAYVRGGNNANDNYGSESVLELKGDPLEGYRREGYMKFDISSVNSPVASAKLMIYAGVTDQYRDIATLSIYSATGEWNENSVTWNTKPAVERFLNSITITDIFGWYEIDITEYVQEQVSGNGIVNLALLQEDDTGINVKVNSRQHATQKPVLRIIPGEDAEPTPPPETGTGWNFTNDLEGWTLGWQIKDFGHQEGGYMYGVITGTDPVVFSPDNLNIDLGAYKKIKVRMKNGTPGNRMKLYFTTTDDTTWGENKTQVVNLVKNDTLYTEYTFDMSAKATWTGTLKQLRLDVIDHYGGGFSVPPDSNYYFSIDYIWLEAEPVEAPIASNVKVSGNLEVGETLTGSYTYYHPQGKPEEGTAFRWLRSETADGTYSPIPGATGITYTLTAEDAGKYLKFEVIPKIAEKAGEPAVSDAVGPVRAKLTARLSVKSTGAGAGALYDVGVEAVGVMENTYAAEFIIEYDPGLLEVVSVDEAGDEIQIVASDTNVPGKIQAVLISIGGMPENMHLFDVRFKAKKVSGREQTEIYITKAEFGIGPDGGIKEAVLDEVAVLLSGMDLNGNDIVDIGDLAIAVYHYRKTPESHDWETAQIADVNFDNIVDIMDLALIANEIMKSE